MDILNNPDRKKLWIYNSGIEHNWQDKKTGVRKINNQMEQLMLNRQSELLCFVAGKEDTVCLVNQPDEAFKKDMEKMGFCFPKTVQIADLDMPISKIIAENQESFDKLSAVSKKDDLQYVPYIVSQQDEENAAKLGMDVYGASSDLIRVLNNKAIVKRMVDELELPSIKGYICKSKEELEEAYEKLKAEGHSMFVLKEPYNSAGKGVFFIKDEKQFYSFLKMMRFDAEKNFEVIIEVWIDDRRDVNYQILISKEGDIKLLTITEQIISVTAYKGTLYPAVLTEEQMNFYKECVQKIGKKLYDMGFWGVIGVDSIIDEKGKIYPIIEYNARFNQSSFYIPFFELVDKQNKHLLIRSYDVKTNAYVGYSELKQFLMDRNLFYSEEKGEGIIILNSTCLSMFKGADDKYENRIYFGNVYDSKRDYKESYSELDELIKEIGQC